MTRDKAADEAGPEATVQSLPTGPQRSFLLKETMRHSSQGC